MAERDGISAICKDEKTEQQFRRAVSEIHTRAKRGVYFDDYVRRGLEEFRKEIKAEKKAAKEKAKDTPQ